MVSKPTAAHAAIQRTSWLGNFALAVVLYAAVATTTSVFAVDQTIGSLASPGDIQLTIRDNGLVRPQTNDGGVINDLWFGGEASSTLFRFNDGSLKLFLAGGGYFDSSTPTTVTAISNSTVGNTVTTQYRLGAAGSDPLVSQVVTLNTGTRSYTISWTISVQAGGPTLDGFRLVYGGDATLLGDDNGTGEWDSAANAVGVIPLAIAGSGRVQLIGLTAPSAYQANNQAQVRLSGSNANLNNGISQSATDIAIAMQWNIGTIPSNTATVVQARLAYAISDQTATPTPASSPTWTPTGTATPTATAEGTLTPDVTPQPLPTSTSIPHAQPTPDDTISGIVRDEAGAPIRGVLVYALQLGVARTDGNGRFTISNAVPGDSYALYIQRIGFDFSGAPATVDCGKYLAVVGVSTDYNPAMCREEDVSLNLSEAASFVREIWEQTRRDYQTLGLLSSDGFDRLMEAYDAYLERSIRFPSLLIKCAKIRSGGYIRRPLEREKRLLKRAIKVLTGESFLANRRLREDGSRSRRDAVRVKKELDRAAARATRVVNRLSRYTFEVQ